jgi:hypothetical protein
MQTPEESPGWLQRTLCRDCFSESGTETADSSPEPEPARPADPAGVAALVQIATDAIADERDRGRALDEKSASLAGFSGVILSVDALLAGPVFKQQLGSVGHPLALVSFFLAMGTLLGAVLLAIGGVLMPQRYRGLGREQLRDFTSPAVQANNELWVHQSMLGALAVIIERDRPVNDCKARLTKGVARLLALAFIFVAVQGVYACRCACGDLEDDRRGLTDTGPAGTGERRACPSPTVGPYAGAIRHRGRREESRPAASPGVRHRERGARPVSEEKPPPPQPQPAQPQPNPRPFGTESTERGGKR